MRKNTTTKDKLPRVVESNPSNPAPSLRFVSTSLQINFHSNCSRLMILIVEKNRNLNKLTIGMGSRNLSDSKRKSMINDLKVEEAIRADHKTQEGWVEVIPLKDKITNNLILTTKNPRMPAHLSLEVEVEAGPQMSLIPISMRPAEVAEVLPNTRYTVLVGVAKLLNSQPEAEVRDNGPKKTGLNMISMFNTNKREKLDPPKFLTLVILPRIINLAKIIDTVSMRPLKRGSFKIREA